MVSRFTVLSLAAVALLVAAQPALAVFCGENGVVRFSFVEGPDLESVATIEPGENGVTMVDLYAWLTDVEPLKKDGEAFLGISAFELQLVIEGAEGFILKQEFPQAHRQVGQKMGNCIVGLYPGLDFKDQATQLVHWEILFQSKPENVVFKLDPEGMVTCERTPGCAESGVSALYVGTEASNFLGAIFGAGYQPAYLNPTGQVDLEEVHGTVSWQDVGEFERR